MSFHFHREGDPITAVLQKFILKGTISHIVAVCSGNLTHHIIPRKRSVHVIIGYGNDRRNSYNQRRPMQITSTRNLSVSFFLSLIFKILFRKIIHLPASPRSRYPKHHLFDSIPYEIFFSIGFYHIRLLRRLASFYSALGRLPLLAPLEQRPFQKPQHCSSLLPHCH